MSADVHKVPLYSKLVVLFHWAPLLQHATRPIPSTSLQEAEAGLVCGPMTSLPVPVREVYLPWGVGAASRAPWASRDSLKTYSCCLSRCYIQSRSSGIRLSLLPPFPLSPSLTPACTTTLALSLSLCLCLPPFPSLCAPLLCPLSTRGAETRGFFEAALCAFVCFECVSCSCLLCVHLQR